MASFRKRGKVWRAEIVRTGAPRLSASFPTKAEAQAWATREEAAIAAGLRGQWPAKTVADALHRYAENVSPTKRGERWEVLRLALIEREHPALAARVLHTVTAADLAEWRDARLRKVSAGSVLREINLLRNVWTTAAREWLWCPDPTPWRLLKMPRDNAARVRRVPWQEVRRIVRRLGFRTGQAPETSMQEAAWAFMVALRTAMRAGEVLSLTAAAVDLPARVVRLDRHKTLEAAGVRHVPITKRAARLLAVLCTRPALFTITSGTLDTLFRKARDQVLIDGLQFRDSRAEALTLLSRRVDVMTLARISGHLDLRTLQAHYYRETAAQIAARL